MEKVTPASDVERRKQVRIRIRSDLNIAPQKYEGKTYYVVKDPVSLRYYRFEEQEHFIIRNMNGQTTLDETQKEFEKRFRPKRLTLEDLEGFAQQLLTAGLAHNESPKAGTQLYDRRKKRKRNELLQYFTNILYIKIPVFDPDKLLDRMLPWMRWIFTTWFFTLSIGVMLGALLLVAVNFESFLSKLPDMQTFFQFGTVVNLWFALGLVKIIHEFGHGLSCKAFGGEVHEMGALFLCLSPCLYCNVSDAWTLPNKWKRIIISFAGIYVELIIAAFSTFYWWNSKPGEFWHEMAQSLMIVCSVSTVMFNANPLMRFDGYYVLADWLEIPNLRDRSNKYLSRLVQEHCLGIELQPEPYMSTGRKVLFITYAITSYLYRWLITFSILYFFYSFLEPYKLGAVSTLLAVAAAGSMVGWPIYRLGKNIHRRGRLPDMKRNRVVVTVLVVVAVLAAFFFVPLPIFSRVREIGLVQLPPEALVKVHLPNLPTQGLILDRLDVYDGQRVSKGHVLAQFRSIEVENELTEKRSAVEGYEVHLRSLREQKEQTFDPQERGKIETQIAQGQGALNAARAELRVWDDARKSLEIKAPRDGVVMSCPKKDEVGRQWDKEKSHPFCSIGDPSQLQVLLPVPPADHRLLREEIAYARDHNRDLPVTIRVQGFAGKTWEGRVDQLQESEARDVPPQLTTKLGGPLAVKQAAGGAMTPQSQHYLVSIDFLHPDASIHPGTLGRVKIHTRWKSCWWWTYRTISSTFNLGLI